MVKACSSRHRQNIPFEWSVTGSTTIREYTTSPNCDMNVARLSSSVSNDKFLSTQFVYVQIQDSESKKLCDYTFIYNSDTY